PGIHASASGTRSTTRFGSNGWSPTDGQETRERILPPTDGKGRSASMLKLEVKTRLPEEQLKQRTKSFFKDGLGLNITAEASDRVTFEGGGGYVTAQFSRDHEAAHVVLETREWEEQAKQFAREV